MQWTESQLRVIENRGGNLLVSAAAGSGKTAVLVERIVRMVSEGENPPDIDRLLVMTFTNAAAAQMRERIGREIEKRLSSDPQNEHLLLQAALVAHAKIMTIDSFCLELIRSHYAHLDIDPAFRMGDEGELSLLKSDVAQALLEECYGQGDARFLALSGQFFRAGADKALSGVLLKLWGYAQSHPWPGEWLSKCAREIEKEGEENGWENPWMDALYKDVQLQMSELIGQEEEVLSVCREDDGPGAYGPVIREDIKGLSRILKVCEERKGYAPLYEAFQELSFGRLPPVRKKDPVDPQKKAWAVDSRDQVKKTARRCRDLFAPFPEQEALLASRTVKGPLLMLLELTDRFDRAYAEKKRERNILDFNDLEHMALRILYDEKEDGDGKRHVPSAVADALGKRFVEILVDEYQDSNLVQEALIEALSGRRFGNPNVFMVGDVKQSIYRFRLAKPQLFMEKYQSFGNGGKEGRLIELSSNFRSRKTVLETVNAYFFRLMGESLGGITYTPGAALYAAAIFPPDPEGSCPEDGPVSELALLDAGDVAFPGSDEDEAEYTLKELEARAVARLIRSLTGEEGLRIWDKDAYGGEGAYRRADFGDIVILFRSPAGYADVFTNVLTAQGIPAFAPNASGYFGTPEVEIVLSLLSILDNPIQDIPLAAVLHSPIVGLSDEEMAWLSAAGKRRGRERANGGLYEAWKRFLKKEEESGEAPSAVTAGIREKLFAFDRLYASLRQKARYLSVRDLLYAVYRESGYYAYVSAMPAGKTRRANLDILLEKAGAYEKTSYKGLFHFVRYIEKLRKYELDFSEAVPAPDGERPVRIMSIHRSKGLEFPIVILAGLGKKFNKMDAYAPVLADADLGIASDAIDLTARTRMPTLKKQVLKRREELETLGEELRILYVGMTRAKEKLILTGAGKNLADKLAKYRAFTGRGGTLPFTALSGASCLLDWLLMGLGGVSGECLKVSFLSPKELLAGELKSQMDKGVQKEALLAMDTGQTFDGKAREAYEAAFSFVYPYAQDTGLNAMLSVSEIKKQSQAGLNPETIGTGWVELEGAPLLSLSGRAARGTAYHTVLERISFKDIGDKADVEAAVAALFSQGFLNEEAYRSIDCGRIWAFIASELGGRVKEAHAQGRLKREQQFIIGFEAGKVVPGGSGELVLVQGVIDAFIEEEDGVILIDYKSDALPSDEEKACALLRARYLVQLDYYEKALCQLTGKKVKERLIYSLTLGRSLRF